MIIIGITGTLGAGKGTISDYLIDKKGFLHFSTGGFITEEIKKRGLEVNRDNMILVGNDLRQKNSPSFIAEQLYERAKKTNKNCIIESLRTVGEIEALKKRGDFYLFAVDANQKKRYERIILRKSEKDNVTFEKFLEQEKKEMQSTDPAKQNISACIKLADFVFINEKTVNELHTEIDKVLEKIEKKDKKEDKNEELKYVRPSWDDYFLEVANAISKRATCDRGRSGCVIARNKQILVTGYVGSPVGFLHCDDVGHQMKKTIHEDGTVTQHCVRTVHAEQNAVCQAAKLGISLDGATVYCRMTPCRVCAMLLINCGIKRVICERKYPTAKESEEMFKTVGIELEYKYEEVQQYKNQ